MNQKFRYTMLGAAIMLCGIGLGAIISPSLIANPKTTRLDEIICSKITVVDENGRVGVVLFATGEINGLAINEKNTSNRAITLASNKDASVLSIQKAIVPEKMPEAMRGITIEALKDVQRIAIHDQNRFPQLLLANSPGEATMLVSGGSDKFSVVSGRQGTQAAIFNAAGYLKWRTR